MEFNLGSVCSSCFAEGVHKKRVGLLGNTIASFFVTYRCYRGYSIPPNPESNWEGRSPVWTLDPTVPVGSYRLIPLF